MQWVNLTSSALHDAMRAGLPAILPLGSIEAHSDHLPLGNDTFKVEQTCIRAAESEPAVVLPPIYYTDVKSTQMRCGAIDMDGLTLVAMVERLCDEVARNGFRKILLASGHGGNGRWMNFLRNEVMDKSKSYVMYTYYVPLLANPDKDRKLLHVPFDGHGGEVESSLALHLFPELTHMERHEVATEPSNPLDFGGAATPYDFAAAWPKALSGDPTHASAEKGKVFFESCVEALVDVVRKIKADTSMAAFQREFEKRRLYAPDK